MRTRRVIAIAVAAAAVLVGTVASVSMITATQPNPTALTADDGSPTSANTPPSTAAKPAPGTGTAAAAAKGFQVGLVGAEDSTAMRRLSQLGAHVTRAEFDSGTSVEYMKPIVAAAAANKVRLQPLIGWENGSPAPDLTGLAAWAKAFGPGGTFWAGKSDAYAITDIELGNENSFSYKSGNEGTSSYSSLAAAYGKRAVAAARAVNAANPRVGVLVELEDGDTSKPTWINTVLANAGPDLARLMHGPVIHPYGPSWKTQLDRSYGFLAAKGVTKPYYITEWGISTDNGSSLSDNFDFPTNLTYAAAGSLIATALSQMAGMTSKIHQVLLFQLADQRDSGTDNNREHYFGILTADGGAKGGLTAAVKNALAAHP